MNDFHIKVVCTKCNAPIEAFADDMDVLKGSFDNILEEMRFHVDSGCKYPDDVFRGFKNG